MNDFIRGKNTKNKIKNKKLLNIPSINFSFFVIFLIKFIFYVFHI